MGLSALTDDATYSTCKHCFIGTPTPSLTELVAPGHTNYFDGQDRKRLHSSAVHLRFR
jgi:hypothetical protein